MLILDNKGKTVFAKDAQTVTSLVKGNMGTVKKGNVYLSCEEAMYLIDIRNAECKLNFSELMNKPSKYYGYKAWRDRGLYIIDFKNSETQKEILKIMPPLKAKEYKGSKIKLPKIKLKGTFFSKDLMTILDNFEDSAKELYYEYWFGQLGTYKSEHRGKFLHFDIYETIYLIKKKILSTNKDIESIIKTAKRKHKFFDLMYNVYEEWRNKGYVLKTGFKFGSHFRLYLPGAAPKASDKKWMHSKHVLHIFPYTSKLLISEWSRAIRVAHSVRKTFILAIPKNDKDKMKNVSLDFLLYHRKKDNVCKPKEDSPKYVMWNLGEEEYIGGAELAYALNEAKKMGLGLILAISDRETSVTFYNVKKIKLPKSKYEYYEIEWVQP